MDSTLCIHLVCLVQKHEHPYGYFHDFNVRLAYNIGRPNVQFYPAPHIRTSPPVTEPGNCRFSTLSQRKARRKIWLPILSRGKHVRTGLFHNVTIQKQSLNHIFYVMGYRDLLHKNIRGSTLSRRLTFRNDCRFYHGNNHLWNLSFPSSHEQYC